MAVLGIPMLLGPIGGPILGGWLIEAASWHWIFLINLPIGVDRPGLRRSSRCRRTAPKPSESFDFVGMLMLSPGLALFLYGVSSLPETGTFTATKVWVPMLVGAAAGDRVRPLLVQAEAPAARPAAVPQPQPDRRVDVAVRVHHRVHGRRPAVPELLPAGPRRVHAGRRPADGAAGHRRDAHHADRRHAGRQDPGRPDRAVRDGADRRRVLHVHPGRHGHLVLCCCAARCS